MKVNESHLRSVNRASPSHVFVETNYAGVIMNLTQNVKRFTFIGQGRLQEREVAYWSL